MFYLYKFVSWLIKRKRTKTFLHITVQQISRVKEPPQSDAIYSLRFCAYGMRAHERLQKLTLGHTISNRLSIRKKKTSKSRAEGKWSGCPFETQDWKKLVHEVHGEDFTAHSILQEAEGVFNIKNTSQKNPKQPQLDVILLCEGYQKPTQVSGHIPWKLLS